tara:strand:+ start:34 stop:462 length:429 start_codon:yes stop_codon:yes gene_type:complete
MSYYLKPEFKNLWFKNHNNKVIKENVGEVHPPFKYNKNDEVESVFTLDYAKWGNKYYKTSVYEECGDIITPFVSNKNGNNKYNYEFLRKMKNKNLILFVGGGWNGKHYTGRLYNVKLLGKAEEMSGNYFKFKINKKEQDYIF